MLILKNNDGTVLAEFLELEDMPPCRACGCAPVVKETASGGRSTRLECPECGIRTGMSTNEQAAYRIWAAAIGPADDPGSGESCRL